MFAASNAIADSASDATLHGWNVRYRSNFQMSGFPKLVARQGAAARE